MAAGSATSSSCALLVSVLFAAFLFGVGETGAVHKVVDPEWHQATATWYGSAEGDGSDGELSTATATAIDYIFPATLTSLVQSMQV
uniref:Predicted protein n=1 Tax=Hordeum vulgare subsp. vulgare TaxID=112509 RepID=F2EJ97_HORVV|nr:predicted protein [Hordeum vulgare subsp. vulgare]